MAALASNWSCVGKRLLNLIGSRQTVLCQSQPRRNCWRVNVPKPGVQGKSYRRIVHFKDKYTVEPLKVTNLGGRDPVTGRLVAHGIGGGIKHEYHWIFWQRAGPTNANEEPRVDKVLDVFKDGCRTSYVALIGGDRELKYILATENMKPGDLIRTSSAIPRIPVKANEGDAYPLGALVVGTLLNSVEKYPGLGGFLVHAAGTCATLVRKDGNDRVIIKMPSKKLFSLDKRCMATVGRLSNVDHGSTHIGSAQRNRELGNRPRSGLWQRKTGRFGRKIRAPPPVRKIDSNNVPVPDETIVFSLRF